MNQPGRSPCRFQVDTSWKATSCLRRRRRGRVAVRSTWARIICFLGQGSPNCAAYQNSSWMRWANKHARSRSTLARLSSNSFQADSHSQAGCRGCCSLCVPVGRSASRENLVEPKSPRRALISCTHFRTGTTPSSLPWRRSGRPPRRRW